MRHIARCECGAELVVNLPEFVNGDNDKCGDIDVIIEEPICFCQMECPYCDDVVDYAYNLTYYKPSKKKIITYLGKNKFNLDHVKKRIKDYDAYEHQYITNFIQFSEAIKYIERPNHHVPNNISFDDDIDEEKEDSPIDIIIHEPLTPSWSSGPFPSDKDDLPF